MRYIESYGSQTCDTVTLMSVSSDDESWNDNSAGDKPTDGDGMIRYSCHRSVTRIVLYEHNGCRSFVSLVGAKTARCRWSVTILTFTRR